MHISIIPESYEIQLYNVSPSLSVLGTDCRQQMTGEISQCWLIKWEGLSRLDELHNNILHWVMIRSEIQLIIVTTIRSRSDQQDQRIGKLCGPLLSDGDHNIRIHELGIIWQGPGDLDSAIGCVMAKFEGVELRVDNYISRVQRSLLAVAGYISHLRSQARDFRTKTLGTKIKLPGRADFNILTLDLSR